jgi:phage-related baseplate assembly protein|nr:MAG TPA_asm: baseplate assembly protein [Caudoviricetes sp.]
MAETIPRWKLDPVNFLETDAETIRSQIITGFEQASGDTLAAGDPRRLFLLSIVDVIIQQRTAINLAAQQNLLSYAQGGYLDALGQLLAVERMAESKAVTTIEFTLSQALGSVYTIPAGTQVTNGVVTFETDEDLLIPIGQTKGEMSASCTVAGPVGNDYLAGQISTIVTPMTFVSGAQNTTITTGGADAESDPDFADRIRLAPNSFSVAGPEKAYVYHAKSVSPAIIDVKVDSPTPGEVDVYVLLTDGTLPTEDTLEQIEEHLSDENIRPLTDYVVVKAPTASNYEIELHYWISQEDSSKAAQIQADVEAAVEQYRLWQQTKIGRDITPGKLLQLVFAAGASRVDDSKMKPAAWKKLEAMQVAQCTKVSVVYEGYKDE